ncbi:hypothetical protein SAMN05216337_1001142 [Bradyrhizobium brasilense]|uniref:Uncharacterized protein n=1 Tax=Bradyrhizobium brasilense TaxID=1419277 RepID=A0A1G6IGE1_9BRAD|nr:hypothetical protein [Bradyrhizobium brasilense]SDC05627.1 hypothetical protein SAMN05216337_1001142 [Bradyrhizobium brasilense]
MAEDDPIKIKKHTTEHIPDSGSYGVHFADRDSVYFYFDDNAGRRSIRMVDTSEQALERAKEFARTERERMNDERD